MTNNSERWLYMKRTGIIDKFKISVYYIKDMPKIISEGLGKAILYAIILCLFLGVVKATFISIDIKHVFKEVITSVKDDKYQFTVENGILNIKTSPIKADEDNFLIYVDDNITLDNSDNLKSETVNSDNYFLFLKDGIVINTGYPSISDKLKYTDLLQGSTFNNDKLISIISLYEIGTISLIFLIIIFVTFFYFLVNALFIAALSMLNNVILKLDLKFKDMVSIAIYASTLPSLAVLILGLFAPKVSFDIASTIGTMVLVFFILRNMGNKDKSF